MCSLVAFGSRIQRSHWIGSDSPIWETDDITWVSTEAARVEAPEAVTEKTNRVLTYNEATKWKLHCLEYICTCTLYLYHLD